MKREYIRDKWVKKMSLNLTDTEVSVLRALALQGEIAQYDLPKIIGKSYRTIIRVLQNLESFGLIKVVRFETASKHGKEKKIYSLTMDGLFFALVYSGEWERIDEIAMKYRNMLLTFRKWDYWRAKGVGQVIKDRVIRAFFFAGFSRAAYFATKFPLPEFKFLEEEIDGYVLGMAPSELYEMIRKNEESENKEQLLRLCKSLKEDEELRSFVDIFIKEEIKEAEKIKEVKEFWERL